MPPDRPRAANDEQHAREARPRVLLVEDNATSRLVVARQLGRLGVIATAVGDGARAVEAVRHDRFDAVLMDRHLPEVDGLQATRLIRRLPGRERLPIIAMTAGTLAEDWRQCLDAGMDDYLTKPVEMARLRQTLERWLP
jgi:CheY-like chemotaxis protein